MTLKPAPDRVVLIYDKPSEVGPEGGNEGWLQATAFRASKVWTGVRCYHKADVWSAAAVVRHFCILMMYLSIRLIAEGTTMD